MRRVIEAKGLTKRYGDFTAVDGISFEVKKGEIFGFLGPNGAGKTTTVRMLSTLTPITAGEAYVNGYDVKTQRLYVKRSIGVVPDVSNLYDELTVEENLRFLARLYDAPMENVSRLIRDFNLPSKKKFGKLSSGYRRRATIAAALIHEPPVLFMDEPTVALDVQSAKLVREMILALNKMGKTIFLTTHNMAEAERLPHRIAIINRGKIVTIGKRSELRRLVGAGVRIRLKVEPISNRLLKFLEPYNPVFDEDSIVVTVDDPDGFLEDFLRIKEEVGFAVRHLSTELPSIEEVFLELTDDNEERVCPATCGGCPI
ncbi:MULTISPECIES: ABC transporter ATP-binding protein [Thermococcus]|uniref:Multidrug ABC transporter ATP-binding protein n=1 Tax=Thermococcus barossii TaxID=54077 RepID=A0A2Z2MCU4_9EURY|nr:ABC transporter ATP-binding protein [Thermococcus barossii]ASJ04460.1 multidrug ABC transporter ATP-binding protein [Thermococcus barossii]NJE75808.1 ABC transporter ATP-binding protein [Thermococcus sp. ES12]